MRILGLASPPLKFFTSRSITSSRNTDGLAKSPIYCVVAFTKPTGLASVTNTPFFAPKGSIQSFLEERALPAAYIEFFA